MDHSWWLTGKRWRDQAGDPNLSVKTVLMPAAHLLPETARMSSRQIKTSL
jgi:hypothetical protein